MMTTKAMTVLKLVGTIVLVIMRISTFYASHLRTSCMLKKHPSQFHDYLMNSDIESEAD